MTASLIDKLAKRGITVRRAGNDLDVEGGPGVLTPEAVAYIKEHKVTLLDALGRRTDRLQGGHPEVLGPLTSVQLEVQAAEKRLGGIERFRAHPTARCNLHGLPQRESRGRMYRCPACTPWAFSKARAA